MGCIADQTLLAGLQELLGPAVVKILIGAFLAAHLGNVLLSVQSLEHDADLFYRLDTVDVWYVEYPDRFARRSLV